MQNTSIYKLVLAIFLVMLSCLPSLQAEAEKIKLNLGAKGVSGPYFPTAGTIADSVNRNYTQHGLRITVKTRFESDSVIKAVMSGKFEFGVARMSHIYQAYKGLSEWEGFPQTELRSVINVHAEQVALLTSVKSGIQTIQGLKNRRVFIGGPHSDLRHTAIDILTASGIDPVSDIAVTGTVMEEAPHMMYDNEIEAFFYIMGIMNRGYIDLVAGTEKVSIVPIAGSGIDHMIEKNPFYETSTITVQHHPYLTNQSDIQVLGVRAGLITTSRVPEKTAYLVVKEIFENTDQFKHRHPTAQILTPREMTTDMVTPIHPGAAKYYRQSEIDYSVSIP